MMDPFNSVNDPLFFMHHATLDYIWALWEEQDLTRLADYSAQPGEDFNANTQLSMGLFTPVRLVKDVMDTQNRDGKGILCFKYEGLPIERYLS
jgi:tyrosinase